MPRKFSLIALCALALAVWGTARAQDSTSSSPSLGDLARQAQKDKDRDKANRPVAKILTNEDLPPASGGSLGQIGPMSAEGKPGANATPAEKIAMLETFLDRVETLDRAALVRSVLNGNTADFPGRAQWEDRLVAAKNAYVSQGRDLVQKARQIIASAESLKGNQDPNDPRIKEMSAKLQSLFQDAVKTNAGLQAVIIEGRDLSAQASAH